MKRMKGERRYDDCGNDVKEKDDDESCMYVYIYIYWGEVYKGRVIAS